MTAVCIVAQPKHNCIHFAGDAAMYASDQRVVSFGTKAFPIAHWPGLVTAAGNGAMVPLFGWELAQDFPTFDDAVANAESKLPVLSATFQLPNGGQFFFVGISEERGPEAYVCRTDDRIPAGVKRAEIESSEFWGRPYQLIRLPECVQTPVPNDQVVPAQFEGFDVSADPETVLWSIDKMLEMQRQTKLPSDYGAIGGFAQCTTIYPDRIEQRVLRRWHEDRVGQRLCPSRMDWPRWHAEHPKPGAKVSRLRQDMAERRERKHLRVAKKRWSDPNKMNS